MKSRIFLLAVTCLAITSTLAQDKKIYTTTSGEVIFSFANINFKGNKTGSIIRFAPVVKSGLW